MTPVDDALGGLFQSFFFVVVVKFNSLLKIHTLNNSFLYVIASSKNPLFYNILLFFREKFSKMC